MKTQLLLIPIFIFAFGLFMYNSSVAQGQWQEVETENQSNERHENAFVKAGDKFYLLGGRGFRPTDIYDPAARTWTEAAPAPIEISHFQAVSYEGLIYVMGGLTGNWPSETPLSHIYIYDPLIDKWFTGSEIPRHRQRGAAGVAVYNDKIYLVCGIVNGHTSGWVPWLDEFDPATNTWRELPDAPRARDHFQAAVVGDKLVAAGGRKSGYEGQGFEATIAETDVYDFRAGSWGTLPSTDGDIPTQRAGTAAIGAGGEAIVIGGESGSQNAAHNEVEGLNPETGTWRSLPSLQTGRHGTQIILSEGKLYIEAGSGNRGGGPELSSLEMYTLPEATSSEDESIIAGTLEISGENHDFGTVRPHTTQTASFELSNTEGNQGILLTYMIVTGSEEFVVDFPYTLPYVIGPDKSVNFDVHYTPKNNQSAKASLLIKAADRGNRQPKEIILKGN
jgi:N-acetylneuraminic acid mutarotase